MSLLRLLDHWILEYQNYPLHLLDLNFRAYRLPLLILSGHWNLEYQNYPLHPLDQFVRSRHLRRYFL